MVVTPDVHPHLDEPLLNDEERTYREAVKMLRSATAEVVNERLKALDQRIDSQAEIFAVGLQETRRVAQAANDALQRLLESEMASSARLADLRLIDMNSMTVKTDVSLGALKDTTERNIALALASAKDTLEDVNAKAKMRHESAGLLTKAMEEKLAERLIALQQLIDLRARMNEDGVNKANESNE